MSKAEKKQTEKKKDKPKINAVDVVIANMKKKFGNTKFIKGSEKDILKNYITEYNYIPTGSLSFNRMTGIGGMPTGKTIEIAGREDRYKSTLAFCLGADAQRDGCIVVDFDLERKTSPAYVQKLGVNIEKGFLYCPVDHSDMMYETIENLLTTGDRYFMIIDSVAAIVTSAHLQKQWYEKKKIALRAAQLSEFFQRNSGRISDSHSNIIMINQYRDAGMGTGMAYKTTTGGNSIPYFATIRIKLDMQPSDRIRDDEGNGLGAHVTCDFKKIQTASPSEKRRLCIKDGHGFWKEEEIMQISMQKEKDLPPLIVLAGSWYEEVETGLKFQGQNNLRKAIEEDKDMFNRLEKHVKERWGLDENNNRE